MSNQAAAGLLVFSLLLSGTFAAVIRSFGVGDEAGPLLMLVKSDGQGGMSVIRLGGLKGLLSRVQSNSGSTDELDGNEDLNYANSPQVVNFNDIGQIGINNGHITEHNYRYRNIDDIGQIGINGVTGRIKEYNYDPTDDIGEIGFNNGQITEHNWKHRDTDDIGQIGINGVTGRIKEYNYDPETANARLIGQIGLNTGQLTSNSILEPGQTDRQPSIGQIGLDLGKRTENNYVLPAGQSQEQQQALWSQLFGDEGSDEDVIGIYNGGRHCLGYHNGQCGIMNDPIQDIDQLGINNGQVYEFNFGKDGKIKITPEGGLKAPAASSGSSERDRRTETRRPDSNSDRRGEKDNRHGGGGGRPDEKEHSRPHRQRKEESKRKHGSRFDRDDKNKWSRGQGKDSRHRDDAERVADFLADIAEIGFNNGHITEYNYRRRQ
ncbi:hypothetical protein BV898_05308 [Hypsibius exemplaris]|uniref:Uncharacterized protein n=1 Tax=Hypsibius exemplaris TaxID=2072580 RepID=A0A1W0WZS6_HYPEX|nr:hypothetical protein BV898_05308 [Hypsibius exemplaris]